MATGNRSLKAQLRQANNLGVSYTLIIGEEELKTNTISLRDMTSAQQKTVSRDELPALLK
jgi:histidyl-tRNA synthetase